MHSNYGLVFDVDGILADTEGIIAVATIKMFKDLYGVEMTRDDFVPFIGTGAARYVEGPAEKYGVQIDLAAAIEQRHRNFVALLDSGADISLPGVHALIAAAAADPAWQLAIATSSPGKKSKATLEAARIDPAQFDAWVHGDLITHKKPHPEIYLRAAQELALAPGRCIAVEDAVTGVASAKAAGMACLAVTNSFPREALQAADCVVESLEEVDLPRLAGLVDAHDTARTPVPPPAP